MKDDKLSYAPKGFTGIEDDSELGFYPNDTLPRSHPNFHGQLPDVTNTGQATPELPPPSLLETVEANFKQYNTLARIQIGANRFFKDERPLVDKMFGRIGWEEGYDPIAEGVLEDVPQQYWGQVLAQTSKQQAQTVINRINQEMQDEGVTARSGWVANLTTTLGASFLSPEVLIPVTQTIKYADFGKSIVKNALLSAASIGSISAAQNAVLVGTKETKDLKDWMVDTLTETFVASALGGALGGFATNGVKKEVNGARAFFKATVDEVDIKMKLSESGEFEGLVASPKGGSVGASKVESVEAIQALLDSGDVSFKDNKFVKTMYGMGAPIVRGLTSKYPVVRELTDKLISHNFKTAAGKIKNISGLSADDFVKVWQSIRSQALIHQEAQWLDYIGVQGLAKQVRGAVGEWTGKHMSKKEFGEMVTMSMRRGGESDIPQVAKAAKMWRDEIYKPLWEEIKKRHPALEDHNFTNIIDYVNRLYDKDKIINAPEQFLDEVVGYLADTNARVMEQRNVMVRANNEVLRTKKLLKQLQESTEAKSRKYNDELAQLQNRYAAVKDLKEDIYTKEAGSLSKKIKKLEKEKAKSSSPLDTAAKDARIKELSEQLDAQLKHVERLDAELLEGMRSGRITPDMIEPRFLKKLKKAGKNIEGLAKPRLRRALTKKQIREVSESIRDNILQLNEEQLSGAIFESIKGGGNDVLQSRVFMWNDTLAEKWLVNDIDILSGLYTDQLSKRIYLGDALAKYGDSFVDADFAKSTKGIGAELSRQHKMIEADILKNPESTARSKELQKHNRDLEDAKKYLENMYKVYMGNYVDKTTGVYRTTNAIKQFGAGTLLNNVPILQLSDFFAPMFKFAFNEYIGPGLIQTLNRMKSVMSGRAKELGDSAYVRGAFADLGLGNNVANGSRMQALFGYGAQYQPKTLIEKYASNLASLSQNVSGSNMISDFNETTVAFASQSKIIRACKKYLSGEELNKYEIGHLDEVRLNPKLWAQRIVDQYESKGQLIDDAFIGNYHLWDDQGAARQIRGSIARETRGIIIRPGLLDQPFAFRDPVLSLATQFTSWIFSASLKYTLPLFTDYDTQKMVGILLMMGSGALIDPLRQLAKGEEVDMNPEALAVSAMTNSGVLGWHFDVLQRMNARIDAPMLRDLQPDRFRRKTSAALSLGPASGMADILNNGLSAFVNGEMNHKDLSQLSKLFVPFSHTILTRRPFDEMLKAFNLPENRSQAHRRKGNE